VHFVFQRRLLILLNEQMIQRLGKIRAGLNDGSLTGEQCGRLELLVRRCYRWSRRGLESGKITVSADWRGKMTCKAAWKLGLITREQFVAFRKASKLKKLLMEA
jgi:hypothetical protein